MTDLDRTIDLIRHSPMLEALRGENLDRKELEQCLEISRATSHRRTRALTEQDLIEKSDGMFTLTELGTTTAEMVTEFKEEIRTAFVLAPVLEAVPEDAPEVDIEIFTDATVTTAGPRNAYCGVNQFISLVRQTDTLRGLTPSVIDPMRIDELYTRIHDGMKTNAVCSPSVIEGLYNRDPEQTNTLIENEKLTVRVSDDLPCGLGLYDDRIGIGIYDDETGLLRTHINTDAPAAYEWAEDFYAFYWEKADTLDWLNDSGELGKREADFPSVKQSP